MSAYSLEQAEQNVTHVASTVASGMAPSIESNFANPSIKATRIYGSAIALLNQTQTELDIAKREVSALREQVAMLEKLATTDALTGLKNLRGFNESMYSEMDRVRRKKSIGGVIVMIDLNGFKAINDTYGHQAGDMCLKLVGQTLYHDLRKMDCAARLGGDEFAILLTDTTAEMVAGRVQYIVSRLNNLSLIWEGQEIFIHASVGMKPYQHNDQAADIMAAADQAMYADKRRSKESKV
jgi:diguanylate cyclase (GGDEF)-like protein